MLIEENIVIIVTAGFAFSVVIICSAGKAFGLYNENRHGISPVPFLVHT